MGCRFCDPNGWRGMTCNFCGVNGGPVVAVVMIATGDDESEFPYSATAFCAKCWNRHGVLAAVAHNESIREIAGSDGPTPVPSELLGREAHDAH